MCVKGPFFHVFCLDTADNIIFNIKTFFPSLLILYAEYRLHKNYPWDLIPHFFLSHKARPHPQFHFRRKSAVPFVLLSTCDNDR